jgi:hypothetical protein
LLPSSSRKTVFFALAHSSLTYCIEIYAKASKSVLNPLITKCNCLLRLLQNKPRMSKVVELYREYNTLPIHLLYKYYVLKLMHSLIYNRESLPFSLTNYFVSNNDVHSHSTRSSFQFNLQRSSCSSSIAFIGPSMWIKLPLSLKTCSSQFLFLKKYKSNLLEEF